ASYDRNTRPVPSQLQLVHPGLGYYTMEQEADDLGLQLLALAGLQPSTMIDMQYVYLQWKQDNHGLPPADEDVPACKALQAKGWRDDAGNPTLPRLGNTRDPHHTVCYRIYNVDMQLRALSYSLADVAQPVHDWDAARAAYLASLPADHVGEAPSGCPLDATC